MCAREFGRRTLLGLLLWASFVLPAGAQGVGAINGTITDNSDAVMPGVAVTLSSNQRTIGANQQTVTDERGAYQFLRLAPGTYIVKAELQGFRPTEQQNIIVNADGTARADLKLQIGTLSEGVTVTGEAPLLDTTSALKQTVIPIEVLKTLPNRFDMWSAARVSPIIVMSQVDVGGSSAFLQSGPTVRGSNHENGYSIDGMDVSNIEGNGGGYGLLPGSVCVSGNEPADGRRRQRGEGPGRSGLQHDHADRHQPVPRRCAVRRLRLEVQCR